MVSVFVIALIASLGGLAVFVGLLWEEAGEKEAFENVEEYRRAKAKAHRGIKWVTWGVFIEVLLGFGIAVYEGHEWVTAEHRLDPTNQPIASVSATANVRLKNRPPPGKGFLWQDMDFGALDFSISDTNDPRLIPSFSFGLKTNGVTWYGRGTSEAEYMLEFSIPLLASSSTNMESIGRPAHIINSLNRVVLSLVFIPPNNEVLGGEVTLVINGVVKRTFPIAPQWTADGTIVTQYSTNADGKLVPNVFQVRPFNLNKNALDDPINRPLTNR